MKGRTIVLDHLGDREAAALMVDGHLDDLLIDADAPRPGTIYRAKATRPVKGQGGMFLDTPDGSAFMRGAKGMAPGDLILVQVSGFSEPGKAIPVTDRVLFKSRYAIAPPGKPGINLSRSVRDDEERIRILSVGETELAEASGFGVILRSACAGAEDDAIAADVDQMVGMAQAVLGDDGSGVEKLVEGFGPHDIAWRDWDGVEERADLSDWLDEARRVAVSLGAAGRMYVEATRALVAVDVNTGTDTSPAAGMKANVAAARALPRALRVQGLGGQVVIDFAPMPKKDRKGLESVLRAALRADTVETSLVGWTPLGHYELSRKRARCPVSEILS